MARRKGWEELSESYRKRLTRGGVSQAEYEAGVSLKSARGHKTPSGVGERTYSDLKRLARDLRWDEGSGATPSEEVDRLLAMGESPQWIKERLQQRKAATRAFRTRSDKTAGRDQWSTRKQYVPTAWYWYH